MLDVLLRVLGLWLLRISTLMRVVGVAGKIVKHLCYIKSSEKLSDIL